MRNKPSRFKSNLTLPIQQRQKTYGANAFAVVPLRYGGNLAQTEPSRLKKLSAESNAVR
jgi:hypothetical protein